MKFSKQMYQKLLEAERKHSTDRHFYRGYCFHSGLELRRDTKEADKSFTEGINNGNAKCMFAKGYYDNNDSLCIKAYPQLVKESSYDNFSKYYVGLCYQEGYGTVKNLTKFHNIMQELAMKEFVPAIEQAGNNLMLGRGVEDDVDKGLNYLELAAGYDYAPAISMIAFLYANGIGYPQNDRLAFENYKRAADMELPSALYGLGIMYINGTATPKDTSRGMSLVRKAAAYGNKKAIKYLG